MPAFVMTGLRKQKSPYSRSRASGCQFERMPGRDLSGGLVGELIRGGDLDAGGEAEKFENLDHPKGRVDLPPFQSMARGLLKGVMIVVPPFPVGQERDPPKIGGPVLRVVGPIAPNVGGGIDKPSAVIDQNHAHENSPNHKRPAPPRIKSRGEEQGPEKVRFFDKKKAAIVRHIGSEALFRLGTVDRGIAAHAPTHVGPEEALQGGMGIVDGVGERVMRTVRGDPCDRASLTGERSDDREKVFDPFGRLKASMGEEPVKTKSNPKSAGDPMEHKAYQEGLPAEGKKGRGHGDHVHPYNKGGYGPIDPRSGFRFRFQGGRLCCRLEDIFF